MKSPVTHLAKPDTPDVTVALNVLTKLQPLKFFFMLALDWALISAGFYLFARYMNLPAFLAGSVLIGFGQHGLVVLGHEGVHNRIVSNRKLNDLVGNLLCFMPIGLTLSCYRAFHFPHHKAPFAHGDPELPLRQALGPTFTSPYGILRGLKLWALSFVGHSVKELVTFSRMLPPSSTLDRVAIIALWITAIACFYPASLAFTGLWLYSLSTTYISKVRIQGWFEHGLEGYDTNRYSLPNFMYRLLVPHNIWVHYEHHSYPAIPFYNLEKARALLSEPRVLSIPEMIRALETPSKAVSHPRSDKAA